MHSNNINNFYIIIIYQFFSDENSIELRHAWGLNSGILLQVLELKLAKLSVNSSWGLRDGRREGAEQAKQFLFDWKGRWHAYVLIPIFSMQYTNYINTV